MTPTESFQFLINKPMITFWNRTLVIHDLNDILNNYHHMADENKKYYIIVYKLKSVVNKLYENPSK